MSLPTLERHIAVTEYESWVQEFRTFQQQVRAAGGFRLGDTKEEIIANLREQRRLIFATEYAHLYDVQIIANKIDG